MKSDARAVIEAIDDALHYHDRAIVSLYQARKALLDLSAIDTPAEDR